MKTTHADLRQFTSTDNYYRHSLARDVLYTDGVQYMAEHCGAYWLLDEIAIAQRLDKRVKGEEFQCWKLAVADRKATLTCDDGNGNVLLTKAIDYTDFPLDSIALWVEGNVILLPSEH